MSAAATAAGVGTGSFFLVVGPSGAGKDTLIDGARRALADAPYVFARRVITRAAGAPGEDHQAETPEGFARREQAGEFLITWQAHGLDYGLPASLLDELAHGRHVVANGSRATVEALAARLPGLVVVEVWAPPEVLAARISGRGREDHAQVLARLQRQVEPMPAGILRQRVSNDADAATGIARFIEVLRRPALHCRVGIAPAEVADEAVVFAPASQWLPGTRLRLRSAAGRVADVQVQGWQDAQGSAPPWIGLPAALQNRLACAPDAMLHALPIQAPTSRIHFSAKLRGQVLQAHEYQAVLADAADGRYTEAELGAFLVATTRALEGAETLALAQARSRLARRISWDEPIVVDKHSLGGVPGSRITPIVVPIVAAFGLAMPKASSRAITSAAGTADTMALLANVELDADAVRRCVQEARACIAWNGRINHSVVDDVMNRITRPYGLDTGAWSVASILSKKVSAGITHLVVDVPYGPYAKQRDLVQAQALCALFEEVGLGLGLVVKALPTDGSQPIGRGIGPALEVRDIHQVLARDAQAPQDLRRKALLFAAQILAFDERVGNAQRGLDVATQLLDSGAAQAALARIVAVQGAAARAEHVSAHTLTIEAAHAGTVQRIDGWALAGLAREAGAPLHANAGVDLLCRVGDQVQARQPLLRLHVVANKVDEMKLQSMQVWAGQVCRLENA